MKPTLPLLRVFTLLIFLQLINLFSVDLKAAGKIFSISIQVSSTNVSVCGNGSDATIDVTPSGGTAPYTYSWTGPNGFTSTAQDLTGLPIGYYNVIVTDADLNSATVSGIHISFAFSPSITYSGTNTSSCSNSGSIILYGSAGVQPYTYSLDGTNYQSSNTFTGLAAGSYTAYLKDLRGCIATRSITMLSAAPVTVSTMVRPASSCSNDGSIELYRTGGVGPYTYSLDDISYQTSNTFTGLTAGSVYTSWVKDAQGCKGSLSNITVTQAPPLSITISKTNSSTCINDGTIQIRGAGGVSPYTYSLDNITYQATCSFASLAAGTYTCWLKDFKGCKVSTTVTLATNPIVVTAYSASINSCNTYGSIQLFKTGGVAPYTYSLDNINYISGNYFPNLTAGVYTGWVKDARGCIASLAGINVVTGTAVAVSAIKTSTSACINDGTIQLNPQGGTAPFSYSMDNVSFQPDNLFTQLGPGNYVCWIRDANGCKAFVNATININRIVVSATTTSVVDCFVPDGTILLSRTGGTGGFTYSLDGENYQTGNLFTGLEEGDYTAFVKDSNVCIGTLSNIIVHSTCVSFTGKKTAAVKDRNNIPGKKINIHVYPNPSATAFIVNLEGYAAGNTSIIVTDIMGRRVFQSTGNNKQQYKFGNDLKPGLYNLQVIQGNDKRTIRLVKE